MPAASRILPARLHGIPPMPTCTCKRQHQRLNSHRQTQTAGRREGTRQLRGRRRRYRQLFLQQAIALVVAPKLPHRGRLSLSVRSSFCCNNVGAFNGSAPSSCSSSCPSSKFVLPSRRSPVLIRPGLRALFPSSGFRARRMTLRIAIAPL